ncbi:hypothetical protein F5B20DRAFT_574536 [Whalleya microplaca]|nr:hypothetical protein F5B20DRAFT_574536 [Whalleya microplaca]
MTPNIVLITGTTRGIGKGLLELYLAKPNHTVISANRDPKLPASQALLGLPTAEGTTHLIVKIDATVPTDPASAVSEVKTDEIQEHVVANIYGFIWLYQAFLPLLKKSQKPTWVTIGSCAAWLTNAAYAPTKLVGHWYTKAIHIEEPEICAFPIDPGWAQTDLGNRGADAFGYKEAAVPVSENVAGIVKVIDSSTR